MRICPTCRAFYADDSAAFCFVEGTPLVNVEPGSEKFSEGTRVLEEKANRAQKQRRRLKWRRILISAAVVLVATRVVYVLAVDGWVYLKPAVSRPLVSPQPSDSPSPARSVSSLTPALYQINGRVVISNRAVARVRITLGGLKSITTSTDNGGRYSFKDLPGGAYSITPAMENVNFTARSVNKLARDETVDFVGLPKLFKISGQVTGNGKPLAQVIVTLTGPNGSTITTGPDGKYSFKDLPAGGTYAISAGIGEIKFAARSVNSLSRDELINFDRVQSDPVECSAAAKDRERSSIRQRADQLFTPRIKRELSEKLASPDGIRRTPLVELGRVDPEIDRVCQEAEVKVTYVWSIDAPGLVKAKIAGTKTFRCHKAGPTWNCP